MCDIYMQESGYPPEKFEIHRESLCYYSGTIYLVLLRIESCSGVVCIIGSQKGIFIFFSW